MVWAARASAVASALRCFWKESDFFFAIVLGASVTKQRVGFKKPHESLQYRGWSRYASLSV